MTQRSRRFLYDGNPSRMRRGLRPHAVRRARDALDPRLEHAVEQHLVGSTSLPSALPSGRPGPGRHGKYVRRLAAIAAPATVVVGWAAVLAVHLLDGHDEPAQAVVLRAVGPPPRVRAEVSMVALDRGTGLHLTLAGAPKPGWCSLVARADDGSSEIAATWPADGLGRVDVSGSTAIPAAQLSELSVVTDTGRRLVSIPVPHLRS